MDLIDLKWLLSGLALPPTGPLLVAIVGAWLAGRAPRHRRRGHVVLVAGLAAAWITATPLFAGAVMGALEAGQAGLPDDALARALQSPSPPGAIVVLAGGIAHHPDAVPYTEWPADPSLARLAYGARLVRRTNLPLLLSGGRPPQRENAEAGVMARVLDESFGLRARWVEDRSRDTADNARESAKLLARSDVRRVVLVTHAFHMRRAAAAFEAAGIDVLPAPHPFVGGVRVDGLGSVLPSASAVRASWLGLHEAIGLAWYRMRGHLG